MNKKDENKKKPKKKARFKIHIATKRPGQSDADFRREQEAIMKNLKAGLAKGEASNDSPESLLEMKKAFNAMEAEEAATGKKMPWMFQKLIKSFWA